MDLVNKTLAPVRRAAHQFFRSQLRLSLRGGLKVSLVEDEAAPTPAELSAQREQSELALIRRQLKELLDDEPQIRDTRRHLAFIEQSIASEGLAALYGVPVEVLQRGLEQFEDLVTNWGPEGLASLRSRMAVALCDRAGDDQVTEASAYCGSPGQR